MSDMLEIGRDRQVSLNGYEKLFIRIPKSLIFDESLGDRRVAIASYLLLNANMIGDVNLSIDKMVEWSGKKPNKHKNKINQKFSDDLVLLADAGYIELSEKPSNSSCFSISIDSDFMNERYDDGGYAMMYLDEVFKIMGFSNYDSSDKKMGNEILLLVFSYLRKSIYQRSNVISDGMGIEARRIRYPDAYDCHYCDMADVLGLSDRQVSKAVEILCDIGLIYYETLPRVKNGDKWTTSTTMFCNRYKREKGFLLECGEEYYMREIANKKKNILAYIKNAR